MKNLKELFAYREMIYMLVKRELRGRYKGSVLGFFWTFLNPLLQLAVYTMVFSFIMRAGIENYHIFLFVALIPWIFLSTSVQGGATCILGQKSLVAKIYFPRQVLPIAHVTTCFVNMLLCFVVVFAVVALSIGLKWMLLPYLVPIMLIEYLMALGLTFIVSGITVYFRDMEHILGILVMAWQFLTPVMYSIDMVPDTMRGVFGFNPMTSVIAAYRDVLYYQTVPEIGTMMSALIMGVISLVAGWYLFDRMQRNFAEEL